MDHSIVVLRVLVMGKEKRNKRCLDFFFFEKKVWLN